MTDSRPTPSGARTAVWVGVTGAAAMVKLFISMASTVILAHLLVPGDFGLMATAGPIMGFIDLLRDAGFSQALVQRQEVTDGQGHSLFWLMMGISLTLGLIVVVSSPFLAAAFHEPRLVGVLVVAAGIMQVSSIGSQPFAVLNRRMRFHALAIVDVVGSALSLTAAATIAALFHTYWALVFAGVAQTFTSTTLSIALTKWRPGRPHFDRGVLQMVRFGIGVSISNFMNFLSRNSDNLLIANRFGPTPLGYYDRAYKLMLMPLNQITWPVSRVLVPVLSRLQDRPKLYAENYLTTITLIMAVAQPGLIAATVLGRPVILFLLGAKWAPAIPIFEWLSAAAIHQVVTSSHGWLYLSQGRARHYAISGTFSSVTTVAAFLVGLRWGPVGVAAAYTITDYLIRAPFSWLYVGRVGPIRTSALLLALWPHLLGGALTAGALIAYDRLTVPSGFLPLVLGVMLAYACYLPPLLLSADKRRLLHSGTNSLVSRIQLLRAQAATARGVG